LFEALFHGRCQGAFEGADDDLALDVVLTRQGVDQQKNFATHRFLPLKSRTGSSLARSTSSRANASSRDWPGGASYSRLSEDSASASATPRMPVKTLRPSTGSRRRTSMRCPANRT